MKILGMMMKNGMLLQRRGSGRETRRAWHAETGSIPAPPISVKLSWLRSQKERELLIGEGCYYAHGKHTWRDCEVTCFHPTRQAMDCLCAFEKCPKVKRLFGQAFKEQK